jgi:YfiH family protein
MSKSAKSLPSSCLFIPAFQNVQSVTAAVSTRTGGVSFPPYNTLNLAYHVGDAPGAVAENRRRLCGALGIDLDSLFVAQQVHGDRIAVVDGSQAGSGAHSHEDAIPDTDGMITATRSVALGVLTADCVPVLIFDPVGEAIGIAHAGWRGALSRIAAKAVLKMRDTFGTKPADCLIALGPSIGSCCYVVGEGLIARFRHEFGLEPYTAENRLDLRRAVEIQLTEAGVEKRNISSVRAGQSASPCTACNLELFYSHRAEGGCTGRMMSVIKLI